MDLLNYQINEIETAHLQVGEEQELVAERTRLANAENLANLAQQALIGLDEGTPESPAVIDLLGKVVNNLSGLANIDSSKSALAESVQEVFSNLSDIVRDLRTYVEEIEFNPQRLDLVEERLNLINNLKRKYGNSIQAILDFVAKARQELDAITHAGERIAELEIIAEQLLIELGQRGVALSAARKQAGETLRTDIEGELADLHMSGAQFCVDFQQRADPNGAPLADGHRVAFTAKGLERVEFLIAPNPGEGFKPLVKIASGGETSRLMLALKNVLARADQVPTLIFDEIDQGIGGHVGGIVGQKLWRLARHHQVLCVTHLPQLAAFGEQHLQVKKQIQVGRTLTLVEDLNGEDRLQELAQMLGQISAGTLDSAREMLKSAQDTTR
jgi:DNA repair protein RecN (Recombination protein N)